MVKDKNYSIIFTGHVDHGKSSVIGRLMHEAGALADGKFEEIQKACKNRLTSIDGTCDHIFNKIHMTRSINDFNIRILQR